jgi:DNA-binding NtrC family response regulator
VARILIHEPDEHRDECLSLLAGKGGEIIVCKDRESLIRALTDQRPDVLVYVITSLVDDLTLLGLLRRVAPLLPIILLGGPSDLASRRTIQELKPTYYGVFPLDASELSDAVRGALHRRAARS